MTEIFTLEQIKTAVEPGAVIQAMEAGFALYTQGKVIVPSVGHLLLDDPRGDVHIKYGYIQDDDYYVVKIASGFYDNPKIGLPSGDGLMLVFKRQTGQLLAVLLDHGYLTDVRTGAAGAVVAKHLAPKDVQRIGIVGAGAQARVQLDFLQHVTGCREAVAWGRSAERLALYKADMAARGFHVRITQDIDELAANCNLIVTTTAASAPLLSAAHIRPGTHITAVGADEVGKQELNAFILQKADLVVADSVSQCVQYGEIGFAVRAGVIAESDVVELGAIIDGSAPGRTSDEQITIADLTGVAIQDIQIAKMVYENLRQ